MRYIGFEGIDGSGTTTQAQLLHNYFENKGIRSLLIQEPSNAEIGRLLRAAIQKELTFKKETMALLFAADRIELHAILSNYNHMIVSDRTLYSSIVYQGIECPMDWVIAMNQYAMEPDITFYLKIEPVEAEKRRQCRDDRNDIYDSFSFQKLAQKQYDSLFYEKENCVIIDGHLDILTIHEQVIYHLNRNISNMIGT